MVGFFKHLFTRIAAFIHPTYRPERYYMRGPGPACARRAGQLTLS
ncbi:hypothetical protein [Fulvimarina pelagi]|nr:hypothetical protein [Fulvimarina pelagi]